jgi:hypothetical protein
MVMRYFSRDTDRLENKRAVREKWYRNRAEEKCEEEKRYGQVTALRPHRYIR